MCNVLLWPVSVLATVLLAGLMTFALSPEASGAPMSRAVIFAGSCCLLAVLLRPVDPARLMDAVCWALLVGIAAGASLGGVLETPAPAALSLAGGIWLTTILLLNATALAGRRLAADAAALTVTSGALLLTATPLFLGPLAEHHATRPWVADIVVFSSPLSHLAALVDYDYLREPWVYQHSRLGSLRFDYPSPVITVCTAVGAALILHGLAARSFHRHSKTRKDPV